MPGRLIGSFIGYTFSLAHMALMKTKLGAVIASHLELQILRMSHSKLFDFIFGRWNVVLTAIIMEDNCLTFFNQDGTSASELKFIHSGFRHDVEFVRSVVESKWQQYVNFFG